MYYLVFNLQITTFVFLLLFVFTCKLLKTTNKSFYSLVVIDYYLDFLFVHIFFFQITHFTFTLSYFCSILINKVIIILYSSS